MTAPQRVTLADILVYLAPVYLGPFLAGLAKAILAVPIVIAALGMGLVAWMRPPQPFPGAGFALRLFALILHASLVAGSFALGLALASAGFALPLPIWLPIGTSVAAGAFALWRLRVLAGPASPKAEAHTPDPTVEDAEAFEAPDLHPSMARIAGPGVDAALRGVWDDAPTPQGIDPVLAQITASARPPEAFSALLASMDEGSDAADYAAMRFLRSPSARDAALRDGRLHMALALGLTSFSDPVRAEACEAVYGLIADGAGPRAFPARDRLRGIASTFPDTAETMAALAAHIGTGGRLLPAPRNRMVG